MLYIKNGMVIDPDEDRVYQADIKIEDGKVTGIYPMSKEGKDEELPKGITKGEEEKDRNGQVIDAGGLMIAPGLADTHVHFRDPGFTYKEDIDTGAAAAAKGGFTQIVLMANTKPSVDNKDTLSYVLEKGKKTGIHINSCANVTVKMEGKELTPMEELAGAGAAGFTDDGIPLMDEALVKEAMECAKRLNKPISFHEENPALIANNGINGGKAAEFYQIKGSPREAEIDLVKRDLELALLTGAEVVIQHISAKESIELLRKAKENGAHVHGEATPHHFTLSDDFITDYDGNTKMNPPLRAKEDVLAIRQALKDNVIEIIATDHAPHSIDEKNCEYEKVAFGIVGLETALPLGITVLVGEGWLTPMELICKMTWNPAKMLGIDKGTLTVGKAADITIVNPNESYQIDPRTFASKSKNTPFGGFEVKGKVLYTIVDGNIVVENGELVEK